MIDTTTMDTKQVLELALEYAEKYDVRDIIVATTTGATGVEAGRLFDTGRFNVVAVTHSAGFKKPGEQEVTPENAEEMKKLGVKVFTGPMPFHSWNDFYRKQFNSISTTTVIADTLRMFGQGTKVVVEIVAMAADAGLIPMDTVLGIAGTGRGADTVMLVKAANSRTLMEMRIVDVVAKWRK